MSEVKQSVGTVPTRVKYLMLRKGVHPEPGVVSDDYLEQAALFDEEGKPLSKKEIKRREAAKAQEEKKEKARQELAAKRAKETAERLEKAKGITIEEDKSLPPATQIQLVDIKNYVDKRIKVFGWVHTIADKGKLKFIGLRDGTGLPTVVQCVLSGNMTQTVEAVQLAREASVCIYGTVKTDARSKVGVEVQADYWELVGPSSGDIENVYNKESHVEVLSDNRHMVLREVRNGTVLKLRSIVTHCIRNHFFDKGFVEVTPPTLVQTQVEGGSTLFKLDYFGEEAFLTQSSQLYLETVVPSLNKVFCILPSFRAEKSRTRRHLSEFTHMEGELGFITYEQLLDLLEDMVVNVAERVVKTAGDMLATVNPDFKVPQRPFLRMDYADAIKYCNENKIYQDEKTQKTFEFGDDISELPERKMTDKIGRPILLCRFPAHMKSFYMARCKEDNTLTESVDLLMPGVGEIVGASMRIWNQKDLLDGYKREGIDPTPYYWYNDLRKYGSFPHGGWGLGLERYLCWMLGIDHIRDVCMYPRYLGRCKP